MTASTPILDASAPSPGFESQPDAPLYPPDAQTPLREKEIQGTEKPTRLRRSYNFVRRHALWFLGLQALLFVALFLMLWFLLPRESTHDTHGTWPIDRRSPKVAQFKHLTATDVPDGDLTATVVTAWWPARDNVRNTPEQYRERFSYLFGEMKTRIVCYTTPEWKETFEAMRPPYLRKNYPIQYILNYTTPYEIPSSRDKEALYNSPSYYLADPARHGGDRHKQSPDLYAVWNAKSWMVSNVAKNDQRACDDGWSPCPATTYYVWLDAGGLRKVYDKNGPTEGHKYTNWPDPRRLYESIQTSDSIFLGSVWGWPHKADLMKIKEDTDPKGPKFGELIQGTWFAGTAKAVIWWQEEFDRIVRADMKRGFFNGRDEHNMNKVAALNWNRTIIMEASRNDNDGPCRELDYNWRFFGLFLMDREHLPEGCRPWEIPYVLRNTAIEDPEYISL